MSCTWRSDLFYSVLESSSGTTSICPLWVTNAISTSRANVQPTFFCASARAMDPDLIRTWLFGPGADVSAHDAMQRSGADALIVDLEDFTPPARREEARRGLGNLLQRWRDAGRVTAVRINALDCDGPTDLAAAMPAHPDVIAYPMATSAAQMRDLHSALDHWERA